METAAAGLNSAGAITGNGTVYTQTPKEAASHELNSLIYMFKALVEIPGGETNPARKLLSDRINHLATIVCKD